MLKKFGQRRICNLDQSTSTYTSSLDKTLEIGFSVAGDTCCLAVVVGGGVTEVIGDEKGLVEASWYRAATRRFDARVVWTDRLAPTAIELRAFVSKDPTTAYWAGGGLWRRKSTTLPTSPAARRWK